MHRLQQSLLGIVLIMTVQAFAGENYQPDSGDKTIDNALLQFNKNIKHRKKQFIKISASEFQVTQEKITELFSHYKFTAADVLMTLSIADVSGQSVNNVSRAYFENKKRGWKFVLHQFDISKSSRQYVQIKKDTEAKFMERN